MAKERSIIEMLLDDNCSDTLKVVADNGQQHEFEQIAVIPLENEIYAILKPITKIEGVNEDEAITFLVDEENEQILVVQDMKLIEKVFKEYYNLLRQEGLID